MTLTPIASQSAVNLARPTSWGQGKKTAASLSLLAVLGSWLLVLLLHSISIGGRWDPISAATWLWLLLWIVAFGTAFLVAISGRQRTGNGVFVEPPAKRIGQLVLVLSAIFGLGVVLFVFDFAVLRGYGFANAAAAIRFEEVNAAMTGASSSSVFSGLGRLLIPAFLPTIAIVVLFWRKLRTFNRSVFVFAMALLLLQQLFFEGGRFLLASTAVIMVFAYLVYPRLDGARNRGGLSQIPYARLALLAMLLLSFFAYVFIDRVLERGDYFATAYLQLASSFQVTPFYDRFDWFEGPLGGLWFSVCMLWLYATQGINELDLILNQPYLEHAHGLYQVPHLGQALLLLTGIDLRYDALANLPTYGSYATFYGHSYVDFGNGGSIVQALVMGFVTGRGVLDLSRGQTGPLAMLSPIMFTLCLFSPVISLVPTIWPALFWALVAGYVLRNGQR